MGHTEEESSAANAKTAYIIDNLYTFMRSGASKDYRLLGSIDAGTQLTILSETENGFIKVRDDKNREGWVETKFISGSAGLHQQYNALKNEMDAMQNKLRQAQIELPELQNHTRELTAQNAQLTEQIIQLETSLAQRQQQKQVSSAKEKRQLLTYGAAIAFLGLFLGIILTVVLSRRKRYEGWA